MVRLPQPGSDNDAWGAILNEFLRVELNEDGTLKPGGSLATKADDSTTVHTSGAETIAGTKTFLASPIVPTPTASGHATTKAYVDSTVSAGAPDATTTTKGLVKLAGDLAGTANLPTVPGLASKEPTITAGTTAQYYRGDKSFQTLDKTAVGLANVDNTSDANKPVSTAQQTAISAKADDTTVVHKAGAETITGAKNFTGGATINGTNIVVATQVGAANGVAPLDASALVPTPNLGSGAASTATYLRGDQTWASVPATADATTSSKGIVQLAGDLAGTAALPTVPGLTGKEPTIAAGTTAQYYRGDKSFQTLDKTAVGLGNVDNTSDATKNAATVTLTNKTLTTPTIASFTNATHNHTNAANGGQLTDAALSAAVTVPKGGTGAVSLTGVLIGNGVSAVTTVAAPTGAIVGTTDTQTLTNKRVNPRVSTTASSATPTPNGDTDDLYTVTALAAAATFGAPTGTPAEGQRLLIRIKDNGTARTMAWNAIYRGIGVTLPANTVISKTLYVGFKYNATDTKWDALAVAQEG